MPAWFNTAFRLPDELLKQIDAHAERLSRETGLRVRRADAARLLIALGLKQVNAEKKKGGK